MKGLGAGGFLGLGSSMFRPFTAAPQIQAAVDLAHRMARQRLECGGAAPAEKAPTRDAAPTDFVVPKDVDVDELVKAIERHLAERGSRSEPTDDPPPLLKRNAGGRVVIRGYHILRLGDGRYDKGRAFLHGRVKDQRARRWRSRFARS